MNFRTRMKEPRLLLRLGLIFFVAASLSTFLHPTRLLAHGTADAIKGLLYGLAIGFMLLSLRRRGCRSSRNA